VIEAIAAVVEGPPDKLGGISDPSESSVCLHNNPSAVPIVHPDVFILW
jgi:hypothetical protein